MKSGIYIIKNKKTGDFYLGSSINIESRWRTHKRELRNNTHHSPILQRAWKKYKDKSFLFMVLEECSRENCLKLENSYLIKLKPVYNISLSATAPMLGRKHSKKTLKKFKDRKALKGKDNPAWGKNWSSEQRKKILASRIGQKRSQKTKNKQSRAAIKRNAHLVLLSFIEKKKRKVEDSKGNVFNSLSEASKFWKTTPASICDCLKGRSIAISKGIQFRYLGKKKSFNQKRLINRWKKKMTYEKIGQLFHLKKLGWTHKRIAKKLKVYHGTINKVIAKHDQSQFHFRSSRHG